MTREEIIQKLREIFKIVVHNGVSADLLTEESVIRSDLGVDSVGLIYMVITIENVFAIEMKNITFNTFNTVGDVVDYIYKAVN